MDFFKEKFKAENLLEGQIFLIDKPLGWTSFQVVNKIRLHLKNKTGLKKLKVGMKTFTHIMKILIYV